MLPEFTPCTDLCRCGALGMHAIEHSQYHVTWLRLISICVFSLDKCKAIVYVCTTISHGVNHADLYVAAFSGDNTTINGHIHTLLGILLGIRVELYFCITAGQTNHLKHLHGQFAHSWAPKDAIREL